MSEKQRRSERAPRSASISLRGRAHGEHDPAGAAESASRSPTVRSSDCARPVTWKRTQPDLG